MSDLLFNYKYEVDRSYEASQAEIDNNPNKDKNHGGKKTSNEFICVHYTAGASSGSTGRANANYFATGGSAGKSSIHYTTGNDGIYHILDDTMVAWHAGDGTGVKVTIADYYSPKGNNIHGVGIEPDEELDLDVDAYLDDGVDNQLDRAVEIIKEKKK